LTLQRQQQQQQQQGAQAVGGFAKLAAVAHMCMHVHLQRLTLRQQQQQ
jgi:hypothetical protein